MVINGSLSRQRFEYLVKKALATLAEEFQNFLENVAVLIEDESADDMPDTMGLYEGVPLMERSLYSVSLPGRIILFKGPIERGCRTHVEIEAEVCLTVMHGIGHFFGLEEGQLELR